jgi:hypothetical protein
VSLEVFGDEGAGAEMDGVIDDMSRRGWEFSMDGSKARWKDEEWVSAEDAIESYLEWLRSED